MKIVKGPDRNQPGLITFTILSNSFANYFWNSFHWSAVRSSAVKSPKITR